MRALKTWMSLGVAAAVVLSVASTAGAAPITFSEYAVGTVIDNEYAALGVTFRAGAVNLPVITPDGAMPNSPILKPDNGQGYAGDFWMDFSPFVLSVSFQSGFWNGIGTAVIQIYDGSDTLLGTFSNTSLGPEDMTFSGLGPIKSVYFNSLADPAGGDIDNLDFAPVPEPGTIFMLGVGLLGLARRSRRS